MTNLILTIGALVLVAIGCAGCSTTEAIVKGAGGVAQGVSHDLVALGSEIQEYNDQRAANRELADFARNSNTQGYIQEVSYESEM